MHPDVYTQLFDALPSRQDEPGEADEVQSVEGHLIDKDKQRQGRPPTPCQPIDTW